MFRNMVTSLLKHDSITTTDAKAKELRGLADHMVTLAKRGDLHARRQALSIVREKDVVHKLFEGAKERFGDISGGYTRIVKIGNRPGDAAPVSVIQLVTADKTVPKKKGKKKAKAGAETAPVAAAAATTATVAAQPAETAATPTPEPAPDAVEAQEVAADAAREPAPEPEETSQDDRNRRDDPSGRSRTRWGSIRQRGRRRWRSPRT